MAAHYTPNLPGQFAHGSHLIDGETMRFIGDRLRKGVPDHHVARMAGCAVADVRRLKPAVIQTWPAETIEETAEIIVIPRKPQVRLSLWRGLLSAPTTMREIVEDVAWQRGFTLEQMRGRAKPRALSHARQEAYWRIMQTKRFTLMQVALYFGHKDHTSALWGCRRYAARLAEQERAG